MEEMGRPAGMEEYDLDKVNANLKAHPAFGQGGAETGRNAAQERGVQEDAVQRRGSGTWGQEHVVQAHIPGNMQPTAGNRPPGYRVARHRGRPQGQSTGWRPVFRLKTELLRLPPCQVHHIGDAR